MKTLHKVLWTTAALTGFAVLLIPAPAAAICYVDDVEIEGSLCVGFDCVCNQAYGFDTIILKENNVRIFFDDTSNSASFPNNDWRITINDSSNGGAEYFGVEDASAGRRVFTLEAGAPAHSLYVDDSGRIGNGTNSPVTDIHIKSGNTPTLRLEQDGSSGFTPQTWDVAGNEANFFVRDATNGSTLPFKIKPGAPNNALYVAADGDVGMNTSSPAAAVDVVRSTGATAEMLRISNNSRGNFSFVNTGSTGAADTWTVSHANNGVFAIDAGGGNTELRVQQSGNLLIEGTLTANATSTGDVFPDYVFEADYELMSLPELQAFIEREKHLPNVMSTSDVNGGRRVNMTKLQLQLLEKVEELTLYTLGQQRTIDALEARLAELEQADEADSQQ